MYDKTFAIKFKIQIKKCYNCGFKMHRVDVNLDNIAYVWFLHVSSRSTWLKVACVVYLHILALSQDWIWTYFPIK